jgi:hypothetical protein
VLENVLLSSQLGVYIRRALFASSAIFEKWPAAWSKISPRNSKIDCLGFFTFVPSLT